MNRLLIGILFLAFSACSTNQPPSSNRQGSQQGAGSPANQPAQSPAASPGTLREGQASGTITVEGETVTLQYAYAGRGEQFGEEAVILLLTDIPVSQEHLAKGFEGYGVFPEGARGLEYKIGKGFWVMYHPSYFQTSGISTLKDYSVENGIVKGQDEDSTSFSGKEYKRSVSFVAALQNDK